MSEAEVVSLMESSKSKAEWESNCDHVKRMCGDYPEFWFTAIVLSGLASRVAASFGCDAGIRIS